MGSLLGELAAQPSEGFYKKFDEVYFNPLRFAPLNTFPAREARNACVKSNFYQKTQKHRSLAVRCFVYFPDFRQSYYR